MDFKRIKCILTGGCKFKGGAKSHIDENKIVTITETCSKCGKRYSFSAPYSSFELSAKRVHEQIT